MTDTACFKASESMGWTRRDFNGPVWSQCPQQSILHVSIMLFDTPVFIHSTNNFWAPARSKALFQVLGVQWWTITKYFTVAFTCLCPSIPGAQDIDNVLPDIFALLHRVLCSESKIWQRWDIRWLKTDKLCMQKGEIHEVCLAKFKKSEWTCFFLRRKYCLLERE